MKRRRSLDGGRLIEVAAHAARRCQRSIERTNDVGDDDLPGRTGQAKATPRATSGDDEPGRHELAQDLLEERRGNREPLRDLGALAPRRIALTNREQRQRSIFGRHSHPHRRSLEFVDRICQQCGFRGQEGRGQRSGVRGQRSSGLLPSIRSSAALVDFAGDLASTFLRTIRNFRTARKRRYSHDVKVAVVIPALDEEASIGSVVRSIDRSIVDEILVGDNGSRDATAAIAREAGARVALVAERGYGAACAGALALMSADVEIVVFMDADGSDDPSEMPALIEPIASGRADLVIGSRALGVVETGALTPQQRFGNWLATRLIALLYGHRYTDLGPYRAIRRDLLDRIGMQDRRYGWTVEMQMRALQLDARVIEVPARYRRRVGVSKISGTLSGVVKAGFWILYTIAKYARRR